MELGKDNINGELNESGRTPEQENALNERIERAVQSRESHDISARKLGVRHNLVTLPGELMGISADMVSAQTEPYVSRPSSLEIAAKEEARKKMVEGLVVVVNGDQINDSNTLGRLTNILSSFQQ